MTYCPYCSNIQVKFVKTKKMSDVLSTYEYACQMCSKHFYVKQIQVKEI